MCVAGVTKPALRSQLLQLERSHARLWEQLNESIFLSDILPCSCLCANDACPWISLSSALIGMRVTESSQKKKQFALVYHHVRRPVFLDPFASGIDLEG